MAYDPPIKYYMQPQYDIKIDEIAKEINEQREQMIMARIRERMAIDIDKNELIRALQYDRGQYDEGYRDGYAAAKEEYAERIQKAREALEGLNDENMGI